MKYECKRRHNEGNTDRNNETPNLEDCESDLSLVPAILVTIVLFSVLIGTFGLIQYLRYLRIIKPPVGRENMLRVVNILLNMPFNVGCVAKPFIYLGSSSRYRATIGKLVKHMLCCKGNTSYEINIESSAIPS